jgi:hypothetical protein
MFLISLINRTTSFFPFISELMDVFMLAGSVQQTDEPNDLAQGQPTLKPL